MLITNLLLSPNWLLTVTWIRVRHAYPFSWLAKSRLNSDAGPAATRLYLRRATRFFNFASIAHAESSLHADKIWGHLRHTGRSFQLLFNSRQHHHPDFYRIQKQRYCSKAKTPTDLSTCAGSKSTRLVLVIDDLEERSVRGLLLWVRSCRLLQAIVMQFSLCLSDIGEYVWQRFTRALRGNLLNSALLRKGQHFLLRAMRWMVEPALLTVDLVLLSICMAMRVDSRYLTNRLLEIPHVHP